MTEEAENRYVCEKCGNEAEMTIMEDSSADKHRHETEPKKGILVCKVCGNEADMILEEI